MSTVAATSGLPPRVDATAEHLRRSLEVGRWSDGQRLPPERELALELKVARTTLRLALEALEQDGLIHRRGRRGTIVVSQPARDQDFVATVLRASPEDLVELRLISEPGTAALAASRATAEDIATITRAFEAGVQAGDIATFEAADVAFHGGIARATRNSCLIEHFKAIGVARSQSQWRKLKERVVSRGARAASNEAHRHILQALVDRDIERARSSMLAHMLFVRDQMIGQRFGSPMRPQHASRDDSAA